jgi:hypothetical protein
MKNKIIVQYKRILLKLSGESLMGEQGYGIDANRLNDFAEQISEIAALGVQIGIVIVEMNYFLSSSQSISDTPKLIPKCSFK